MMASNTFYLLSGESYKDELFENIGAAENPSLLKLDNNQVDARVGGLISVNGNPTIGFGFDFKSTGFDLSPKLVPRTR